MSGFDGQDGPIDPVGLGHPARRMEVQTLLKFGVDPLPVLAHEGSGCGSVPEDACLALADNRAWAVRRA